jgi:hypothetical protein
MGEELRYSVLWDEVVHGPSGPWPTAGTVLFLWPRLHGDLRRPAWASRPGDPEDENAPWWNGEDSKVSAARLLPFFADLVAFLCERAGPAQFESPGRLEAARRLLRRVLAGQRQGVGDGAARPIEELAALIEGAPGSHRGACTVTFGTPVAAVLHARREERCLWLWLAPALRDGFDRFGAEARGGVRFIRCAMDWSMAGTGLPAPRPPQALQG